MKNRRIERTTLETYRIAPERKLGVKVGKQARKPIPEANRAVLERKPGVGA